MAATVTTSVLLLSILIGTTSSSQPADNNLEISAFKRSVLSDDQFIQTPIPLVLVDKVQSLREDLITITALLGTYVLLYEETSFNPPIIQIVDVLLVLESLSQNIRPKEDQVDWVTEVQIRYAEVLQNPTGDNYKPR